MDKNGNLVSQDRVLTFGLGMKLVEFGTKQSVENNRNFLSGKRRCLGDALAKTCIFLYFVEILRKYRIVQKENSGKLTGKQIPGITMTPEKYRAKFIPRYD